jgi:hypothetical protein
LEMMEAIGMSEPNKKIILLRADTVPADKMLVMMTAVDLRDLVAEVVEQKLKRLSTARSGLLNTEQAAEFLCYSPTVTRHLVQLRTWQGRRTR